MIVCDTNVWIAYLAGLDGKDTRAMDVALTDGTLRMAPVVLAELLSDRTLDESVEEVLNDVPIFALLPGFWARTGRLRGQLLAKNHKPKLADALIAQTCIDHAATLITRDVGFKAYTKYGLQLF